MTAALLGFAASGFMGEGDPVRTLKIAMWLVVSCSVLAALSPSLAVLLAARVGQGIGVGLMIAGGLTDVPRRLPRAVAGRMTGAMISGTAVGGLLGRAIGYSGLLLTWRGAFAVGGAGVLGLVAFSLARMPRGAATAKARPAQVGGVPLSLIAAGFFILFVSVGMFDLLPYRLASAPFGLSLARGDLVYLVFVLAAAFGPVAGRAVDRFGPRAVILGVAGAGIALLLVGLIGAVPALVLAAAGAICGSVGLHVAHSSWAASYGRAAVGRYLSAYYVGGAAAAPLMAAAYQRWGWPGVTLPLAGAWALVALLALARKQPDRTEGQALEAHVPPSGAPG